VDASLADTASADDWPWKWDRALTDYVPPASNPRFKDHTGEEFGKYTVRYPIKRKGSILTWAVQCVCGEMFELTSSRVCVGKINPCGCASEKDWLWKWDKSLTDFVPIGKRFIDLTGQRFGKLVALYPIARNKFKNVSWQFSCDCGSRPVIDGCSALHGSRVSCGCARKGKNHNHWKGFGDFPGWYLSVLNARSKYTNHEVTVTTEQIASLFEEQDRKCALSGISIEISEQRRLTETTASLDRIDSARGYVAGNIQWVHKDINMMKQKFSNEYFVEMYCQIAANVS